MSERPDVRVERVVESENSSSDIVVRGTPHAIEITLDPLRSPFRRLDVYPEDVEEFVDAVQEAAAVVEDPHTS